MAHVTSKVDRQAFCFISLSSKISRKSEFSQWGSWVVTGEFVKGIRNLKIKKFSKLWCSVGLMATLTSSPEAMERQINFLAHWASSSDCDRISMRSEYKVRTMMLWIIMTFSSYPPLSAPFGKVIAWPSNSKDNNGEGSPRQFARIQKNNATIRLDLYAMTIDTREGLLLWSCFVLQNCNSFFFQLMTRFQR